MRNKKVIFAIILFLLIGLTIFTFANPSSNEKTFDDDNDTYEKVDGDKDGSDKESEQVEETQNGDDLSQDITTNDNLNGNNQINRITTNTSRTNNINSTDNSKYYDALQAVEKSEKTLTQQDVNTARDKVSGLDSEEQKSELNDRLNAVQGQIEDNAKQLVQNLENQVKSATKQENIQSAREYKSSNDIESKVGALNNGSVKDDLLKRLESLRSILEDTGKPVIEGVLAEFTNTDVTLTVKDNTECKVTVNGEEYTGEMKFTDDGEYKVTVTDEAFNSETVTFTIDKTNPKITGVENNQQYKTSVTPVVEDANLEELTLNGEPYVSGTEITEDGTYVLEATDKAGNTVTVTFTIDKNSPIIKVNGSTEIKGSYNSVSLYVTDANEFTGTIKNKTTGKTNPLNSNGNKVDKNYAASTDISSMGEGEYEVTVKDAAGNTTTITFTYDKTAAKNEAANILVLGDSNETDGPVYYANENDKIYTYVTFNEELGKNPTYILINNGKEFDVTDKITVSHDKATGYYTYTVVIPVKELEGYADGEVTFKVKGIEDKTGNKSADITAATNGHSLIIDTVAPKVWVDDKENSAIREDGVAYTNSGNANTNVHDANPFEFSIIEDDKTVATLPYKYAPGEWYGNTDYAFRSGISHLIKQNKKYTIKATDKAGNTTEYAFVWDKTAPAAEKVTMENNSNMKAKSAKFGDWILVSVTYNEELRSNPVLTIGGNTGEFVSSSLNEDNSGLYTYVLKANLPKGIADGKIPFTVSEAYDKLGNKADDVTAVTEGAWIVVDNTKSDIYVGNYDRSSQKEVDGAFYTNDPNINVYDNNPFTFVVKDENGKVLTDVLSNREEPNKNGKYFFRSKVNGTKTDGKYTIEVTDEAGNVSTLTYTYDSIDPMLNIAGLKNNLTQEPNFSPSDANLYKIEVYKGEDLVKTYQGNDIFLDDRTGLLMCFGNLKDFGDGEYTIIAYDKAGNKKEATYIYDATAPTVGGTAKFGGEEVEFQDGGVYQEVTLNIQDNFLGSEKKWGKMEIRFVDTNGKTNNSAEMFGTKGQTTVTKKFTEEGTYTVDIYDMLGNKTTVTFTIDTTKPTFTSTLFDADTNEEITGNITGAKRIRVVIEWSEPITDFKKIDIGVLSGSGWTRDDSVEFEEIEAGKKYAIVYKQKEGAKPTTFGITVDGNAVKDLAGNGNELKWIRIEKVDSEAPKVELLEILNLSNLNNKKSPKYANEDAEIRIRAKFNEELTSKTLKVKMNDTEVGDATITESGEYQATLNIKNDILTKTDLPEGEIKFELIGIEDKFGHKTNETGIINNNDIKTENGYDSVIYDNTDPVITYKNGTVTIVENNNLNYKVYKDGELVLDNNVIHKNTDIKIDLSKYGDGEYRVVVVDDAGNEKEATYIYDVTAPTAGGTAKFGGEEVKFQNGGVYQEVTLNIQDNFLASEKKWGKMEIHFVDTNGKTNNSAEMFGTKGQTTVTKKFTEEGTYTVDIYDMLGNKTTVTFTIDTTKPTFTSTLFDADTNEEITGNITGAKRIRVVIEWSEPITDFKKIDIGVLSGSGWTRDDSVEFEEIEAGKKYAIVYKQKEGAKPTTFGITVDGNAVKDLAGNGNELKWIRIEKVDSEGPNVEGSTAYSNGEAVAFENGGTYQKVELKIHDDNFGSGLNGGQIKIEKTVNGVTTYSYNMLGGQQDWTQNFDEEAEYKVTIVDKFGNETILNFVIDKNAPEVTATAVHGTEEVPFVDGSAYKKVTLSINDANLNSKEQNGKMKIKRVYRAVNEQTEETYNNPYTKVFTEEGYYEVTIQDLAGNSIVKNFIIDNTIPVLNTERSKYPPTIYKEKDIDPIISIKNNATDNFTASQDLKITTSKTINTNSTTDGVAITIEDEAGNSYKYSNVTIKISSSSSSKETVKVSSAEQLKNLYTNPEDYKGKNVILTDDIDLNDLNSYGSSTNWHSLDGSKLSGLVINGNGHTIKNMKVSDIDSESRIKIPLGYAIGFIGYDSDEDITIKNIKFDNANVQVTNTGSSQVYAGVVIGYINKATSFNTLDNITVKNSLVYAKNEGGGIVGHVDSGFLTLNSCIVADTRISGSDRTNAGSLIGGTSYVHDTHISINNSTATNVELHNMKTNENYWIGSQYSKSTLKLTDSYEYNVKNVNKNALNSSVASQSPIIEEKEESKAIEEKTSDPLNEYKEPSIETPESDQSTTDTTEEENTTVDGVKEEENVPEVFPYLGKAFNKIELDTTYTSNEQIEVEADVEDKAGIIWWAEFSCDMDKCEGFKEHDSDNLSDKVIEGRRGDIRSITMEAPKAKEGYKFVGWKKYEVKYDGADFSIQGFEAIYDEEKTPEIPEQDENQPLDSVAYGMILPKFALTLPMIRKLLGENI